MHIGEKPDHGYLTDTRDMLGKVFLIHLIMSSTKLFTLLLNSVYRFFFV